QKSGLGSVPANQNVYYQGFAVVMTPKQFLNLVPIRTDNEEIVQLGLAMKDTAIGSPFLQLDASNSSIKGHEGRGRVMNILKTKGPNTKILVHVLLTSG